MTSEILELLDRVATEYPPEMRNEQIRDIPRIAFNIGLALGAAAPKPPTDLEICDLGGGIGLFSLGCAAMGFRRAVLIDDFSDSVNQGPQDPILDLHRRKGVEILSRDLVLEGIETLDGHFDVITSFDSMEHWHQSPKRLFQGVVRKLKPGGAFILGTPNCVNIRKRMTVPFGFGKWSAMQDWYEAQTFRGHIREPDVDDLRYIARDMKLIDCQIIGRNWAGHRSSKAVIRLATKFSDALLRLRPSLCSDIYLVGMKSGERTLPNC